MMIVTTTPSVEGHGISAYLGVVFGEVISGVDFVRDFAAGLTNFFGGRSGTYEEELMNARETALRELEQRARDMKDRDYLWCLVHSILDREERLERLCPECREQMAEERCPACGRPVSLWGDGAVNPAFDPKRFEELKGSGGG